MESKSALIGSDKKRLQGHKGKCGSFQGFSSYTTAKDARNQNFLRKICVEKWKTAEATNNQQKNNRRRSHYHEDQKQGKMQRKQRTR